MRKFKIKNRLKIPNRVAALAAILLLVSSVADTDKSDTQTMTAQQMSEAVIEETVNELATVTTTTSRRGSFNISSLIFRF